MKTLILLSLILTFGCASKEKVSKAEKKARIYLNKGTNDLVEGKYTSALKNLLEANSLKPNDSEILNALGMSYYFKQRDQTAIRYIKQALEVDPKNTKARLNLGTIYTNTQRLEDAKIQFGKVLEDLTYEGQFKTYYNLGQLYLKTNNENKALSYFKQSLGENPQYCPSHFFIGEILFKRRQYKEALDSYKAASYGTCYNNPKPIYYQALSYIKLKEYDTARIKLEEVIERFRPTEYGKKAEGQLQALNKANLGMQFKEQPNRKKTRNILSPDF